MDIDAYRCARVVIRLGQCLCKGLGVDAINRREDRVERLCSRNFVITRDYGLRDIKLSAGIHDRMLPLTARLDGQ